MNVKIFIMAELAIVIGHVLRLKRWSSLIGIYERPENSELWKAMTIGYGIDFFLPFHAGDIAKGIVAGRKLKNKYAFAFSTIFIDRLLDIIFVAGAYWISWTISGQRFTTALIYSAFSAFLIILLLFCTRSSHFPKAVILKVSSIFNKKIQLSILKFAWSSICIIKKIIMDVNKWLILLYSILMWGFYLLSYYLFAVSLNDSSINFTSIFNYLFASITNSIFSQLLLYNLNVHISKIALYMSTTLIIMFLLLLVAQSPIFKNQANSKDKIVMPFSVDKEQLKFLKEYFAELKSKKYFYEFIAVNSDVQILKNCSAGSNATTLLCRNENGIFFRKYAFGEDADKLYEQIGWLLRHTESIPVTKIRNVVKTDTTCSYDMPFYPLFSDYFTYIHSTSSEIAWNTLKNVISALETFYSSSKNPQADDAAIDAYIDKKIFSNLEKIKNGPLTSSLYEPRLLTINGVRYKNLCCFEKYFTDKDFWKKIFKNDSYADIHGDLTIENIICCNEYKDGYYLIDPNGGNIHNSPNLDYAKLLQSLHGGYEFLMHTQSVKFTEDSITYEVINSSAYERLYARFQEYLAANFLPERVKSIYFHEIVHWLRLMPYKINKDSERSPMFYAGTVIITNDIFNKFLGDSVDE